MDSLGGAEEAKDGLKEGERVMFVRTSMTSEPPPVQQQVRSSAGRREFLLRVPAGVWVASTAVGAAASSCRAEEAELLSSGTDAILPLASAKRGASIKLPSIGLGAWSWGDSIFWGYDKKNDGELESVFDYALAKSNVTLIDTAEIYGLGRSETLVGQFASSYPEDKLVVATKFAALPFRTSAKDVVKACRESLKRLGRSSIDLYQIHFPNAWSNAEYWDGLAECVDLGLVKAVGVSNYGVDATRACHAALQKRGIPLSTNQIQLSLLYRYPIENGLLSCCQDLGIQVLSYSPLALGMLGGRYTPDSPPSGPRKAIYEKLTSTSDYGNLLAIMKDVAAVRPGATLSQVAINWAIAKNTIPIPGARTLSQVQQNYGCLSWSLSPEEVRALDVAASKITTFLQPQDAFFVKEDINTHLKMFDS
jgi:pyridoxine 4-dehydrogenase